MIIMIIVIIIMAVFISNNGGSHGCGPAGLAVRDIPEDSGVELGSGWEPALTGHRGLGERGQIQDGLHFYLYSFLTLL